ncbi:MAG: hypothetical protein WCI04_03575 [archaeon]
MSIRAQAGLEYLMTYGIAIIGLAVIIGSILLLTSQSSSPHLCQINPSSGGLTYKDHFADALGNVNIMLRNDSGKSITSVSATYSGDFKGASQTSSGGPFSSSQDFTILATSGAQKGAYSGTISIQYTRNGVVHSTVANCSGNAS